MYPGACNEPKLNDDVKIVRLIVLSFMKDFVTNRIAVDVVGLRSLLMPESTHDSGVCQTHHGLAPKVSRLNVTVLFLRHILQCLQMSLAGITEVGGEESL